VRIVGFALNGSNRSMSRSSHVAQNVTKKLCGRCTHLWESCLKVPVSMLRTIVPLPVLQSAQQKPLNLKKSQSLLKLLPTNLQTSNPGLSISYSDCASFLFINSFDTKVKRTPRSSKYSFRLLFLSVHCDIHRFLGYRAIYTKYPAIFNV